MYLSKSNKDIKYLSKRSGVAREVRTAPRDTLKRCDNIGVWHKEWIVWYTPLKKS